MKFPAVRYLRPHERSTGESRRDPGFFEFEVENDLEEDMIKDRGRLFERLDLEMTCEFIEPNQVNVCIQDNVASADFKFELFTNNPDLPRKIKALILSFDEEEHAKWRSEMLDEE